MDSPHALYQWKFCLKELINPEPSLVRKTIQETRVSARYRLMYPMRKWERFPLSCRVRVDFPCNKSSPHIHVLSRFRSMISTYIYYIRRMVSRSCAYQYVTNTSCHNFDDLLESFGFRKGRIGKKWALTTLHPKGLTVDIFQAHSVWIWRLYLGIRWYIRISETSFRHSTCQKRNWNFQSANIENRQSKICSIRDDCKIYGYNINKWNFKLGQNLT